MYNLHDTDHRRMPQQMGYQQPADTGPSTRGSLVALLIFVTLLGGLVAFSSINGMAVDEDGTTTTPSATAPATDGGEAAGTQYGTGTVAE